MTTWLDHALVLAFAVLWPIFEYPRYQAFKRRVRAGVPGVKLAEYMTTTLTQWLFVFVALLVWAREGRDASELGLSIPAGNRAIAGLAVAAILSGLMAYQAYTVATHPNLPLRARDKLAKYADLLPGSRSEFTGFACLSITAGICEEVLFRGVLTWHLSHWLGYWGANTAALAVFGAAHLYLGVGGALRAVAAGAIVTGLYMWTGSLWASILLHAAVDASSGWMGYSVLSRYRSTPGPASSPAMPPAG